MKSLIIDALAAGRGKRTVTRDVIGSGPRAIAGVLEKRGLKPRIAVAEALLTDGLDLLDYDLIFLSGMTTDLPAVRRVISKWKAFSSGPVILGGPISSNPMDALTRAGGDLAVVGEGEQTLEEILDLGLVQSRLPNINELVNVRGIAFIDRGKVLLNDLRPVMRREDYDRLSPSTRVIRDYPLYHSARVYVEVLRGCSNYLRTRASLNEEDCIRCRRCQGVDPKERYDCPKGVPPGCGYCSVPSLHGPPKSRSTMKILNEILELLAKGVKRFVLSAPDLLDYGRDWLLEPEPLTDPRHPEPNYVALEKLLSSIIDIDEFSDKEASVMIENVKASLVTDRAAKLLGKYLSGAPVNIGFETGSREHSLWLGRPSMPEENLRSIRKLKNAGLKPYIYFIHGLPGQTKKTVNETVKAIEKSITEGASRIILYRFKPLPMSAFSGQPEAPPAAKDKHSGWIYEAALKANRALKESLVGRILRVVIAEPYERDRRLHVAYPLMHGPVVLVEGSRMQVGTIVDVEISRVVSDRIIKGYLKDARF